MIREYVVIIEQEPTSYGAYAPDLSGCAAVTDTEVEARQLIREAIALHVESLQEDEQIVPEPRSHSEAVAVATA